MPEVIVNNPNIFVDAPAIAVDAPGRRGFHAPGGRLQSEAETSLLRRLREVRHEIEELTCSATWAEDCLYRGADYVPDFECSCPVCRTVFPHRRHPRDGRESKFSIDCQVETHEDPELAEDLARLRNDRPRIGSVFVGRSTRTFEDGRLRPSEGGHA